MKSAQLERQLGKLDEALKTLELAIKKYPQFDKLHMIRGQIYDSKGDIPAARTAYAQGCKSCPKSIPLWILSARLEVKAGVIIKARALLERARLHNPKNDELWTESIRIEETASGPQQAKSLLARGKLHDPRSVKPGFEADVPFSHARMPYLTFIMGDGHLDGEPSTT